MIVVVGVPGWRAGEPATPAGLSALVAMAAAAAGASVELVGRVGDDAAGDALLIALSRAGVGHAAVLRDPAKATPVLARAGDDEGIAAEAPADEAPADGSRGPQLDAGDLELGLSYLTDYRVVVVADPVSEATLRTIGEAAAYADVSLVVVSGPAVPASVLPTTATVLQAPDAGDAAAFAQLVAAYAVALDRGEPAESAFRAAVATAGWASAEADEPFPGS